MKKHIDLDKTSTLPVKKINKGEVEIEMLKLTEQLTNIQDKLYAQNKYGVLIILQGMDTAGKDSAVKHVFSGVNPAGCNVKSFKAPTEEESAHHFLWRISKECPPKGMIKIFNRSHYEDVLVPMVRQLLSKKELEERCHEINTFEKGLVKNNTIIIKFFLHISHQEQVERLAERKTNPHKQWKYQEGDVKDIAMHKQYKNAYEFIFENCGHSADWHIIPADKKWYKNYLILQKIVETLSLYDIDYPKVISKISK